MSEILFRIAKPSDAIQIADLHWKVRDKYSKGIFLSLGKGFLRKYWEIILNDPWSIIICASNDKNKILGFTSTTLKAEEESKNLKKHKFTLAFKALSSIVFNPKLFFEVWKRYASLSNNTDNRYIHSQGVRGSYWCWDKEDDSLGAFDLIKIKNEILKSLGVKEFLFEVDKENKAVYRYHLKINKAMPLEEFQLNDGRTRILMKKTL